MRSLKWQVLGGGDVDVSPQLQLQVYAHGSQHKESCDLTRQSPNVHLLFSTCFS
jgi:hypothetical protein